MAVRVVVRLNPGLADLAGRRSRLTIDLAGQPTVNELLALLARDHPAVARRIHDEQGRIRPHVNIFVGAHNIRDLDGADTTLTDDTEVTVLPAVSGG